MFFVVVVVVVVVVCSRPSFPALQLFSDAPDGYGFFFLFLFLFFFLPSFTVSLGVHTIICVSYLSTLVLIESSLNEFS